MQIILFVNYNQRISPALAIMQALFFCPNALLCDVLHHMNVMHVKLIFFRPSALRISGRYFSTSIRSSSAGSIADLLPQGSLDDFVLLIVLTHKNNLHL